MTVARSALSEAVVPATPEVYNAFLKDLDLTGVRMVEGAFASRVARPPVSQSIVDVAFGARYLNTKDSFEAMATLIFRFLTEGETEPIGTVRCTLALSYTAAEPMTDSIWAVFSERNLRPHAWRYAREFAQSATQRMDWPKFTLPVANSARSGAAKRRGPKNADLDER